ncbi:carbohydrate ABC transporter permease [Gracilinema caldarium]|uniref:ABC-type transporter, integral membrane subunit n=1 Tax=Gracilinema caldarium (strain ATCC 51460 / DSM 7334 / H1) TaxID=744872 RepID=F8EZW4_GRAC1|nr:sugar ABC transporter permease [Gracilinema caldarium]AEJ18477.1 ABC-type transporter, integral membrane subunit [Gracilinema caldarium DSM 7334]
MRKKLNQIPLLIFLLGPALVLFTFFVIVPVFRAAYFSLFKWNGFGPLTDFRGIKNFVMLYNDKIFHKAIIHNFVIMAVSLIVEIPLALYAALILANKDFKLAVVFRTFFFLPYVLSEVITGILWQFIYNPQYGLVKAISTFIAPGSPVPAFLAHPNTVLAAILITIIWKYFGFHMSILIAGLQDIPDEIKEAAKIDGATEGQTTRKIVLPLLRPTLLISIFFSIVGSFQVFDVVWAMGKGDPVNSAETMVTYLYKFGLQRLNIGYGSAVAVTIFLLSLIFSLVYNRQLIKNEER